MVSAFDSKGRLPVGHGGVPLSPGGGGVSASRFSGVSTTHRLHHTPLCGQTNTCENITLLQTSFAAGKNIRS